MLEPWCERTSKGGIKVNKVIKNPMSNMEKAFINLENTIFLLVNYNEDLTQEQLRGIEKHLRKIRKKLNSGPITNKQG